MLPGEVANDHQPETHREMIILSEESDEVEQPPETHVPYQLEAPKEETVNVTAENACV